MIILESIRVRNFRAIREAVFKPLDAGITGIFGSNGAGKTTFLAATLFALFGVKPPGASVASLRRTGSAKEECSASVLFQHLGQTVEVIRELKGSNNRVVVNIFVDGIPETVTSVGAADTWIGQRLGVDAAGFMTAFVVRQKELDALVNARPAERKAIIEKLAGIETINEALKKARKNENIAKEILNSFPGSESAISEAEAQVLFLTEKADELSAKKDALQAQLLGYQHSQKTLSSELETLRDSESKLFKNETLVNSLKGENENHAETLKRLEYLSTITDDFDIEALRESHKTVAKQISEKTQELNSLRVKRTGLENKIVELSEELSKINSFISNSSANSDDEKDLKEESFAIEESIKELSNLHSSALARQKDMLESIATLEHSTECPTCHTHLADPKQLISSLNELSENYAKEAFIAKENLELNYIRRSEVSSELSDIKHLLEWNEKSLTISQQLNIFNNSLGNLEADSAFELTLESLNIEKDKISEIGVRAKNILNDRQALSNANVKLTQNTATAHDLERELIELRKNFSMERLSLVKTQLSQTQTEAERLSSTVNESFSELSNFQSRLLVANNHYKSVTEQWKRKKELLVGQEKKALTTELIEKFRQESVASLAPELSEYATELISDITNGAYTEIRLDDEFNVSVVSSTGDVRNVSWLSGGEESAVAFALRLAIAFLITGGNPSLLWLDEVLTAQDEDRRTSMLSTIRNLPIDQIIMINHSQGATDVADKAVTVIPDVVNGSTLQSDDGENDAPTYDSLDDIEDDTDFM